MDLNMTLIASPYISQSRNSRHLLVLRSGTMTDIEGGGQHIFWKLSILIIIKMEV